MYTCGDVSRDPCLSDGLHPVSDRQVPSHAGLPAEHYVMPHCDRSSHPYQRYQEAVRADARAVSNRNEVGELGAASDSGFAHGGPFNGTVSTNLDIVLEYNDAMLGDLVMFTLMRGISKAVIANHSSGMQCDPISKNAMIVHHTMREQDAVVSDRCLRADPHAWVEMTSASYGGPGLDHRKWVDMSALADLCGLVHHGKAALSGAVSIHRSRVRPHALQGNNCISERKVGILADQGIQAFWALHAGGDQDGPGGCRGKSISILGIGKECELIRARSLDACTPIDVPIRLAAEIGTKVVSKFSQGHAHEQCSFMCSGYRRIARGGTRWGSQVSSIPRMGRFPSILLGLLMLLAVSAWAGAVAPDSDSLLDRPIGSIQVKGLERVTEQTVLNNIRSRVGQPYDPETAQGDISRLTRLGDFSSIDIVADLRTDGTVDLTYVFQEERLLAAVSVVGNRVLADRDLLGPTGLHRGSPRDDFLIQRGIREMEELYRGKGYYLAEVSLDSLQLEDNNILIFEVIEGPRVRTRSIIFDGATSFTTGQLWAEIETTTWFPFFRRGEVDQDQLAADVASLQMFYHDRGWIDARIDKEIEVSPSQREAKVIFLIEEGRRYTVEEITASAPGGVPLEVFSAEQLAAIMNIQVGDVFRKDLLTRSRESINGAYGVLGYLDARASIVPIRRGTTTGLTLIVEIREGKVADVGLVNVTGNILTKDKIIRAQIGLIPGRRFDASEIKATKERIMSTGLFGDAKVAVQAPNEDNPEIRDVLVEIKEKNTGSINFGVGIGSDAGVLGNISLTQNNFDLFDVPETFGEFTRGRAFRGAGQRFAMNFQPGTEIFAYDISLTEPQIFGTPYALGGSAGYFRRSYDSYTEERSSVGMVLSRRLGDVWYASLRLNGSSVELTNLNPFEPVEVLQDAGPETLISTGLTLTRTTIDQLARPTRGSRTQLDIANWGMIGGDRNFNRVSIDYTTYLALHRDFLGRVTTLRIDAQVGQMFGGDAPTYERFYLGGRSFRGFKFRQVSPMGIDWAGNVTDVPVGGTFMFFAGTQYQHPLMGELLDGVAFIDSGTVTNDPGFDQYRVSVGIGLRVYIPQLGPTPLAFDFAIPLIQQDGDQTQLFSFSADLPF